MVLKRCGAFGARGSSQDLDRLGWPAQREGAPYNIILSYSKGLPQKGFAAAHLLSAACIFRRDPLSLARHSIPERHAEKTKCFSASRPKLLESITFMDLDRSDPNPS
jgi:hypothetical protein